MAKNTSSLILLVSILLCSTFLAVGFTRSSSVNAQGLPTQQSLSPTETLLGAGALWAANGGMKVAYVDFYDNYVANPNLYSDFNPLTTFVDYWFNVKNWVVSTLEGEGFAVDALANIPANLSQYNLVILDSYFSCEPANEPAIQSYISNGGGVVIMSGTIAYLAYYSKTMNVGQDLSSVEPWFGAAEYVNTGGTAYVTVANPLGTSLNLGDPVFTSDGPSAAAITCMSNDSQVLASWEDDSTFAFTHEFGQGRVYYQADLYPTVTQQPQGSNEPLTLTLLGGFDYGVAEPARVKVCAELTDPTTMQPISGANVTIQVFDPNDNLWISASMNETITGTGFYEWDSPDTVTNMNLQPGVYIAQVSASYGSSSASDFMLFHIDPSSSSTGTISLQLYLTTLLALVLGGMLIVLALLKKARTTDRKEHESAGATKPLKQ
jgi:hypothetical protein